jgi:hypothetical protein
MIVSLYSVYDRVAKEYGPLFEGGVAGNDDAAVRKFRQWLLTKAGNEGDYELYYCGEFNRERGCIGTKDTPKLIAFTKIDPPEPAEVTVEEAVQMIREKLGDRVSDAALEEFKRDFSKLEKMCGDSKVVARSHLNLLFELFGK